MTKSFVFTNVLLLVIAVVALTSLGVVMLTSTGAYAADSRGNPTYFLNHHLLWLGVGAVLCIAMAFLDYRMIRKGGLADSGIKESLSRLKSALRNSNYQLPVRQRVVFNLKPAYHRKKSEGLDLAFAIGFLLASKQLQHALCANNDETKTCREFKLEG